MEEFLSLTSACRKAGALVVATTLLLTAACATRRPAPVPSPTIPAVVGLASYYAHAFHGKVTASGARFDMHAMVAAHPTYAFGTRVRVTNLANGRTVILRIVDRGPAAGPRAAGVVIDVSYGAARALDFIDAGLTRVRVEIVERRRRD